MTIVPDAKDWTWVITAACPECGFDANRHDPEGTAALVRAHVEIWNGVLCGAMAEQHDPRVRDRVDVWSPLEYACHVRDVCRIYNERLLRMVHEENPLYQNWDQDATAVEARYAAQDPVIVAEELSAAAYTLAGSFDTVAAQGPTVWARTGRRSDGAAFTIATFSQYFTHDLVHHLWDIQAHTPPLNLR